MTVNPAKVVPGGGHDRHCATQQGPCDCDFEDRASAEILRLRQEADKAAAVRLGLDEVYAELPALMGRASKEGHEAGQTLARQVRDRIDALTAVPSAAEAAALLIGYRAHGMDKTLRGILLAYRQGTVSEGQCCRGLNLDRAAFRALADALAPLP